MMMMIGEDEEVTLNCRECGQSMPVGGMNDSRGSTSVIRRRAAENLLAVHDTTVVTCICT